MTRIKPTLTKSDLYDIINEEARRAIAELRIGSTSPIGKYPTRGERGPSWPAYLDRASDNNIRYMGSIKEPGGKLSDIAQKAADNADKRALAKITSTSIDEEESPEGNVNSEELILNAFQELLASDAVQEEILNMLQSKLQDSMDSDDSHSLSTPSALSEASIGCGSKKICDKRKKRRE